MAINKFKKLIGKNKCKFEVRGNCHFCSYYQNRNRMFTFWASWKKKLGLSIKTGKEY